MPLLLASQQNAQYPLTVRISTAKEQKDSSTRSGLDIGHTTVLMRTKMRSAICWQAGRQWHHADQHCKGAKAEWVWTAAIYTKVIPISIQRLSYVSIPRFSIFRLFIPGLSIPRLSYVYLTRDHFTELYPEYIPVSYVVASMSWQVCGGRHVVAGMSWQVCHGKYAVAWVAWCSMLCGYYYWRVNTTYLHHLPGCYDEDHNNSPAIACAPVPPQ